MGENMSEKYIAAAHDALEQSDLLMNDTIGFQRSHIVDLMASFAAEMVARREKQIADELFNKVLSFNNDPRHEEVPDPCVMCDTLEAVSDIWIHLGTPTETGEL